VDEGGRSVAPGNGRYSFFSGIVFSIISFAFVAEFKPGFVNLDIKNINSVGIYKIFIVPIREK